MNSHPLGTIWHPFEGAGRYDFCYSSVFLKKSPLNIEFYIVLLKVTVVETVPI